MTPTEQTGGRHFIAGNFYEYTPNTRWCKDGIAEATKYGLEDTYWGGSSSDCLSAEEAATATTLIDLLEFEEIDRYVKHEPYAWTVRHPDDRRKVAAQHGCCPRWLIRRGSQPDMGTKIKNAEKALVDAVSELQSAKRTVEWKRRDLDALRAEKPA